MDGSSLDPLTLWQRVFWFAAIAVLIIDLLALFAAAWPGPACGCG
jgi:hypothetical protein